MKRFTQILMIPKKLIPAQRKLQVVLGKLLLFTTTVYLLLSILSPQIVQAGILGPKLDVFVAERDCRPSSFGLFHQCAVTDKTLISDPPSPTENTFIKALNFKGSVETYFRCEATKTLPAGFKIDNTTVDILMQPVVSPRISTVAVPYSGGTYTFFVKIDNPAEDIWPGCIFSVTSNTTVPEIEPIRNYTNLVLSSIESRKNEIKEIDEASTLPAKWIVLIKLSGNLESKRRDRENELKDLKSELITLESKSDLSDFEATRLRALPGLIQVTELKIKDFELLIPQIEAALPESSKCIIDNPADRTFCLDKVTEIKESLNAASSEDINTVKQILNFLDAEFLRLKDVERGIGDEAKKLACQIGTTIGSDVSDCPPAI